MPFDDAEFNSQAGIRIATAYVASNYMAHMSGNKSKSFRYVYNDQNIYN